MASDSVSAVLMSSVTMPFWDDRQSPWCWHLAICLKLTHNQRSSLPSKSALLFQWHPGLGRIFARDPKSQNHLGKEYVEVANMPQGKYVTGMFMHCHGCVHWCDDCNDITAIGTLVSASILRLARSRTSYIGSWRLSVRSFVLLCVRPSDFTYQSDLVMFVHEWYQALWS